LSDHLAEAQKTLAYREGRPYSAVLQCVVGPSTELKKDRVRKPKANVINALQTRQPAEPSDTAAVQIDIEMVLGAIEAALGGPRHG
jgi:Fe-S cluster assembly scaffold protein SufB